MTVPFPRRTLLASAAALAALAAMPYRAFGQDIRSRIIRYGYGLGKDTHQGRAVEFFAQQVGEASGGKLRVRTFPDGTLGPDMQMQSALIGGSQEMMVGSTATLVGIVPEFALWDLPFLFNNEQEADAVLDGPIGQEVLDKLPPQGLVGLVYYENGFRNLTNSKRPIATLQDLAGLKLRVMQNPVFLDVFAAMQANPVPLPFSELFTALETGAVDGQENPVNTIETSKFYEVQKYLTLTRHVYSPWIVLASKSWWDQLSADEQKILMDAAVESRDFQRKDSREQTAKALEALKEQGMQVVEPTPEEMAQFRAAAQPTIDKYAQQIGGDLPQRLFAELEKMRA
jgi:tripartite ATP-independent transporter DctP family solute receptor